MNEVVWRGFTRAALDAAYNNSAAVKNSAEKLAEWQERSRRFRAGHGGKLDVRYGPRQRDTIDIFHCGKESAPLLAYIHGGYWQRNAKEFYSCLAVGPLAHGFDCAFIGYTLAPDVTMTEIVAEVRAALRYLRGGCDKTLRKPERCGRRDDFNRSNFSSAVCGRAYLQKEI